MMCPDGMQYCATIGQLEPSFVIRRFLDAQRIHNLTSYLEALHTRVRDRRHASHAATCRAEAVRLAAHRMLTGCHTLHGSCEAACTKLPDAACCACQCAIAAAQSDATVSNVSCLLAPSPS